MTPRQAVLKAHPTAYLWQWKHPVPGVKFSIKCASYPGQIISGGITPKQAWERAASVISARKGG
jgi:hypothetical protein